MVIIFDLLSFLLINYLAVNLLTIKRNHYAKYALFISTYILICLLNLNGINMFKALGLLILYITYLLIQYKGTLLSYCFVVIPFFTFQIFSETLVAFILSNNFIVPFFHHTFLFTYSFSFILGLFGSFIFLVILTLLYTKIIKYIQINNLPYYTCLIFIVPIVLLFFMIIEANYFNSFNSFPQQYSIIIILCILSYILTSIIFILIINYNKNTSDLKIEKYKSELIESKYKLINQHYLYNFNFFHNLIHSYSHLYKLINDNEIACAKEEVQKLMDETYKEFNMIYSNSIILNYLINQRLQTFKNKNIECVAVIEDEKINIINFEAQFNFFDYILDISEHQADFLKNDCSIILIKSKTIASRLVIQCIFPYHDLNISAFKDKLSSILYQYQYQIDIDIENNNKLKLIICFLGKNKR